MTRMWDIESLRAVHLFIFFVNVIIFYHISTPGREKAEVLYVCSLLIPLQGWNDCFSCYHQNFHSELKWILLEGNCTFQRVREKKKKIHE